MPAARWLDFLMSGTTVTSMRRGNLIEVLFGFANVLADYMLVSTRAATWQFVADDFGRQGFLVSGGLWKGAIFCTRRLWPRPIMRFPSAMTQPMGIPPSANPALASAIAAARNRSVGIVCAPYAVWLVSAADLVSRVLPHVRGKPVPLRLVHVLYVVNVFDVRCHVLTSSLHTVVGMFAGLLYFRKTLVDAVGHLRRD